MALSNESPQRRRRGDELETALLDAAWAELDEKGYDELTFDAVAARAGTSRAVLYRRWPGKPEMVRAAIAHGSLSTRIEVPDTGALRGDLIAVLRAANERRMGIAILISARLGDFYRETGSSFSDLRDVVIGDRPSGLEIIMERAVARGEIDPAKLTPRIARLPFDLFRLEVLMTFQPLSDEAIHEIIDDVFLPLVGRP